MSIKINNKIKVILGNFNFKDGPHNVFDKNITILLNKISTIILNNKECKKFPDLISFGFWCRANNIKKIINNYYFFKNRLGRGTVLHITPSNVPTNFVYSMVFGLMSGNNNIVRLPSKNFTQVRILCNILKTLSKKKKYKNFFDRLLLIKYEKSDLISSELSKKVEARIIWGGDKTIDKFKSFKTKPRCIDLTFANRYSISLINSNKLNKLNSQSIKILAEKFFNDAYTMDQFGCSSPIGIFWVGKNNVVKKKFWFELNKVVNKSYSFDLSAANQKITNLMNYSLKKNTKLKINMQNFNLVKLNSKERNFDNFENAKFGTFLEINLKNLNSLKNYVSDKLQTLTYYGTSFDEINNFILKNKIKGIDRVVPIGRAFELNPVWDGTDIISTLSRTIGN